MKTITVASQKGGVGKSTTDLPKYATETCTLCGDPVDPEHPTDAVYDHSPQTFRRGWMHVYCVTVAIEDLDNDRRDAYYQLD